MDETVGEYFDSLGRAPDRALECYMNSKCTNWTYSRRQLQSILSAFVDIIACIFVYLEAEA